MACAQIVWAETSEITANSDDTKGMLRELRGHIAAIAIATEGAAFAPPEAWNTAKLSTDDLVGVAECVELATKAVKESPQAWRVLIWSGEGSETAPVPPDAPYGWSALPRLDLAILGPFLTKGTQVQAFLAPGTAPPPLGSFVSVVTGTGVPSGSRSLRSPKERQFRSRRRGNKIVGYALAAASLTTFVMAAAWTLNVGAVSHAACSYFKAAPEAAQCQIANLPPSQATATPPEWATRTEKPAGTVDCAAAWRKAQDAAFAAPIEDRWTNWWRSVVHDYSYSSTTGELSLRRPLGLMMGSMLLLIFSAGFGVLGRASGILIDPSNRISLTRSQLAAWMVVLIAGWATLALFNMGFSVQSLRDLVQMDPGGSISEKLAATLSYPRLDWQLWALLGISVATPGLAAQSAVRGDDRHRQSVGSHWAAPS